IITSATIDPERFANHFSPNPRGIGVSPVRTRSSTPDSPADLLTSTPAHPPVPILEVSGRTYPVETRYRALASDDPDDRERSQEEAIRGAVDDLGREAPGAPLIFPAGERETRQPAEALRKHHPPGTEILPLFARLSAQEQMRIFQPHNARRIVLATNVA